MFDIIDSDDVDFDDEFEKINNHGKLSFGNQYKPTSNKQVKLDFDANLNSSPSQYSPTYSPKDYQISNSQSNIFHNLPQTSTQRSNCAYNSKLFDQSNILSPIKMQPGISSIVKRTQAKCKSETIHPHRKFPGPAGYLPQIDKNKDLNSIDLSTIHTFVNNVKDEKDKSDKNVYQLKHYNINSQFSDSESWNIAKQKIGGDCWQYFEKYNVKQIILNCIKTENDFKSKVPVICLKVSDIDYLPRDASAILCDDTGSIKCAIHRHVLHRYKDRIKIGAVFIMKNVSLFSPSGKRYYLNVTDQNIIDIIDGSETADTRINTEPIITESQIKFLIDQQKQKIKQETTQPQFNPNILNDSNFFRVENIQNKNIQQPVNNNLFKAPSNSNQITFKQPQNTISHGQSDNSFIIKSIFDDFEDDEEAENLLSSFTEEDFDI